MQVPSIVKLRNLRRGAFQRPSRAECNLGNLTESGGQAWHPKKIKAADLNQWLNHFISSGHVGYFKGKEGKEHYLMSATYA
jgi:hypothetical protein